MDFEQLNFVCNFKGEIFFIRSVKNNMYKLFFCTAILAFIVMSAVSFITKILVKNQYVNEDKQGQKSRPINNDF